MKIGFTGTRSGMSAYQKEEVKRVIEEMIEGKSLKDLAGSKVSHGGCIGADIDFHNITYKFWREVYPGHPNGNPSDNSMMGEYSDADKIHPSQGYFKRNRDIVDNSTVLIATPYNDIQRGGTWYTINYAKRKGIPVIIINREKDEK